MDADRKRIVRKVSGSKPDKTRTREEKRREEKINTLSRSQHLESQDFVSVWDAWKNKQAVNTSVMMDSMTEDAQLYQLAGFKTDEAIEIVRYSVSRTNCRNLIVNGDHKAKPPRVSHGQPKRMRIIGAED
jgi:hypothetical protein